MKKLIRFGGHRNPLIAVLRRAGIGSEDKVVDRYGGENCRGIWVDTVSDREKLEAYIASAPERVSYPNCNWVFGTNIHNEVSVDDFDRAIM